MSKDSWGFDDCGKDKDFFHQGDCWKNKDFHHDDCCKNKYFHHDDCCQHKDICHDDFSHHNDPCHHDCCKGHHGNHHCFYCDPCDFLRCRFPFQVRLAGIQPNLAFQLFRMKGCKVTITFECAGTDEDITGKICNVGTTFVNIKVTEGADKGKVVTIMLERICKIKWPDKDCNPCKKCRPCHDCDPCCHDDFDDCCD